MTGIDELTRGLWQTSAIKFGSFTLKSGVQSPFYINLRFLITIPSVLKLVAHSICEITKGLKFDRVAGIPYAGLPPAVLISQELNVPLIYPRQEKKKHGDIRAIEGAYSPGETVIVVDDLITNGQTKLEAIQPLTDAGLIVEDIVVLIDREQGGVGLMAGKGYSVRSVMSISDLLNTLKKQLLISETEYRLSIDYIREVQF
jgi:uridine monophosphate synthetase